MIKSHAIVRFRRFGLDVNQAVWIEGKPCFTARAISEWLGLKEGTRGVDKIARRNPHLKLFSKNVEILNEEVLGLDGIFDSRGAKLAHQCPLKSAPNADQFKIPCNGQNETFCDYFEQNAKTRTRKIELMVFNLMGLLLIAFESHTQRAIELKIRVAYVISKQLEGKLRELTPVQQEAEDILTAQIDAPWGTKAELIEEFMKTAGVSRPTAYRYLAKAKEGQSGFDKDHKNCTPPIIQGDLALTIRVIFFENPNQTIRDIWRKIGSPEKPSYSTVKEFVNKLKEELRMSKVMSTPGGEMPMLINGKVEKAIKSNHG